MKETQIQNIDQYIATFPEATQVLLVQMRAAIRQVATDAKETMKYGMPTFEQEGNLVHFAAKSVLGIFSCTKSMNCGCVFINLACFDPPKLRKLSSPRSQLIDFL